MEWGTARTRSARHRLALGDARLPPGRRIVSQMAGARALVGDPDERLPAFEPGDRGMPVPHGVGATVRSLAGRRAPTRLSHSTDGARRRDASGTPARGPSGP